MRTSTHLPFTSQPPHSQSHPHAHPTALQVETEGDVATAFTLARIMSNIPQSRGGPTSLVIFDIHALQERFYFGDAVLPLFESGLPLLLERLKSLPDADNVGVPAGGCQWPAACCCRGPRWPGWPHAASAAGRGLLQIMPACRRASCSIQLCAKHTEDCGVRCPAGCCVHSIATISTHTQQASLHHATTAPAHTPLLLPPQQITIAYPDEGAWKRFHYQFKDEGYPEVICTKVRDGSKRIVRLKEGVPQGRHVVIVDDLVQSGGTLIECHALLSSLGAKHGEQQRWCWCMCCWWDCIGCAHVVL